MFGTVEEAGRAAQMAQKVTGRSCTPSASNAVVTRLPTGEYQSMRPWEEVADFVEHFAPEPVREEEVARRLADVRRLIERGEERAALLAFCDVADLLAGRR